MRHALVGAAAFSLAAAPALARPPAPPDADLMTVSGRQGLPPASAGAPRFQLGAVTVAPSVAARTGYDGSVVAPPLRTAVHRSLSNHGFATPDPRPAPTLNAEWTAVEVAEDEAGALVTARLRVVASDVPAACLPYEASGQFRSLARQKSGAGRRIAGVLGTVATLGTDGGTIMARQMEWASEENKAKNRFRAVGENEGVATGFGPAAVVQYGAANAMRLALVDLLTKLNGPECTAQPTP